MLILTRRVGEAIKMGDEVTVAVLGLKGNQVKLGIAAGRLDEYEGIYGLLCIDTHGNTPALAERHLSERPDGGLVVSIFGQYDPWTVIRRLDLALGFLLRSARDMHGAFEAPAPEVDQLAAQLELVKAERAEPQPDPFPLR